MHLQSIIMAISWAALGINVFMIFLSFLDRQKVRFNYLLLLFVANLISNLDNIYELSEFWRHYPQFYNVYLPFLYLIGPAIFLYLRSLVYPQQDLSFDWKSPHWLVFWIALMLCMPYFFMDSHTKLSRLMSQSGDLEHLGIITLGPYSMLLLIIPFSIVYLILSLKLLTKNTIQIKSFFSNIENKDLSWVRWTVFVFMLALIIGSLQLFMPDAFTDASFWKLFSVLFDFSWLAIFGALTLRQQPIYIKNNPAKTQVKHNKATQKYQKSPLNRHEIEDIKSQLNHAMEHLKLYRKPGFTLRDLADELAVSQNKISQVLNNDLNIGFYDFVNQWRVKEACSMIAEGAQSMLDIAFAVGFNAKSTFNTAFKKYTKMTPSQFKKHKGKNTKEKTHDKTAIF